MNSLSIEKQYPGRKSWPALLIFTIFIIVITSCSDKQPIYPPAQQNGSNIEIDISTLESEIPKFFTYHFKGKKINYFALRIGSNVNSYLDACASCFPYKMGYSYSNGQVTCTYCKLEFSVHKLELEKGLGLCYPVKIEGKADKRKYIIPVKLLEKKSGMF